jgi:hypothetical protein
VTDKGISNTGVSEEAREGGDAEDEVDENFELEVALVLSLPWLHHFLDLSVVPISTYCSQEGTGLGGSFVNKMHPHSHSKHAF